MPARCPPDGRDWADLSDVERAARPRRLPPGLHLARRRSTGPRAWAPCCPTRRSPTTAAPSAATSRSSRRNLRQWMMRITAYADRLADDLDRVDWPEKVKIMQRNWIGRSQGARVAFPVVGHDAVAIEVFTTRPDTLFGATFMVLAPEHPLVDALVPPGGWPEGTEPGLDRRRSRPRQAAVAAYRLAASRKSDVERQTEGKDKTGVFTGAFATNPVNGQQHPGVRRRLRPDGLRHRRDHGGARRRTSATGTSPRSSSCRSSAPCSRPRATPRTRRSPVRAPAINSSNDEVSLDGLRGRRGQGDDHRLAGGQGVRRAARSPTSCATGCSAGSATGASRSRSSSTRTGSPTRVPGRRCCRSSCRTCPTTLPRPSTPTTRAASPSRRWVGCRSGSTSSSTWATAAACASTAARPTRCPTGPGPAGTTCATSTRPTTTRSSTRRTRRTGWGRTRRPWTVRPRVSPTPAASTSTSAASSTPCCTCCTPASGTRCCYDLGHVSSDEPFRKYFSPGLHPGAGLPRRPRPAGRGVRGRRGAGPRRW